MRYDLSFFLCCCKSFLGDDNAADKEDNFYTLLGLDRDASNDEIKRAYKRQSLQMHPDKLAQRGQTVTPQDQARFTRMKEAYEVLSDQHKRETYDAIGERGMKWIDEPFSMDPQELAHNFANSSVYNRSKIFAIFIAIAILILILPILICLHVDGIFGPNASWIATLIPLWIWNIFVLFYHTRIILMGPITRPDHIPIDEWIDPLPMKKRIFSFIRFTLIVIFEILITMKLDSIFGFQNIPWFILFFPIYIWEGTTLYKKWPLARMRIVTVDDLELALGKKFHDFTLAEKELIGKRYSVVPSVTSTEFDVAQKLKTRARHDIIKSIFRIIFIIFLLIQLDSSNQNDLDGEGENEMRWNWWIIFTPFWIMTILICYANYQAFADVQQTAMKKDPTLFGITNKKPTTTTTTTGDVETGDGTGAAATTTSSTGYGAVGMDGNATPSAAAAATTTSTTSATSTPQSDLTDEEREELKAVLMASSSRLCSKCCSQGFLLFVVILFVAKLQGATFSSLWIISPFLFITGIILICLACAIFGITEVPTDGVEFDASDFGYTSASSTTGTTSPSPNGKTTTTTTDGTNYAPPSSSTAQTSSYNQTNVVIPAAPEPPRETEARVATESITTGPASVKSSVCHPPSVSSSSCYPPSVSSPMVVVPVMAAHPNNSNSSNATAVSSSSNTASKTTSTAPLSTPLVIVPPPKTAQSSDAVVTPAASSVATTTITSAAAPTSTAAATTPLPAPTPTQTTIDLLDDIAAAAGTATPTPQPVQVINAPSTTTAFVPSTSTTAGGSSGAGGGTDEIIGSNEIHHDLD